MSDFLRALITGAIAGGIYSLIGVGLVVTYTVTKIFDLAYGGVAFVSALTFYELNTGLGWNRFLVAALVILVFGPILGALLFHVVYRPLASASDAVRLVVSVGLLVALPATAKFIIEKGISAFHWGLPNPTDISAAPGLIFQPRHNYKIASGIIISSDDLAVIVAGVLVGIGLWLLFRSPAGLRIRAVQDRKELARLRNIDDVRVSRNTSMLGSSLAALAGVLGAPILSQLDSGVFTLALFVAAAAVVFGGFKSVPLTYAGGILLGILTNLTFRYVHISALPSLNQAVPFIFLLVGLVVLGRNRSRLAGVVGSGISTLDYRAGLPISRRLGPSAVIVVVFFLLAEFVFADFWVALILRSLAISVILLSITVMTGMGGMVSLAQATFSISSALTTGLLVSKYGWPFLPAACVGVAIATVLGVIVALPSLRLGGVPLTLATLALALMGQSLILGWSFITNHGTGWLVDRPHLLGLNLTNDKVLLAAMAVIVLLLVWGISNLRRSPSGRAILALRASEAAATSVGLSGVGARLKLFALSAAIAGLGGSLLLLVDQGVSSDSTSALDGLTWLTIMVVLGASRPLSAVVGGMGLILFPGLLSAGFTAPFGLLSWSGTDSALIPAMLFGLSVIDLARNQDGVLERFSKARYYKRVGVAVPRQDRGTRTIELPKAKEAHASPVAQEGDGLAVLVRELRVHYDLVEVLHAVDASFPAGKVTVVLGANGAGKTTLLNTIAGATSKSTGTISSSESGGERPVSATLVPEGRGVFPSLSVHDNLKVTLGPAEIAKVYERFPALAERRQIAAGSLSGGEQQMLSLAPMLISRPALLLVDEPALGLAPIVTQQVIEMLQELSSGGATVVIADEKQSINDAMADHTLLLANGRAIWEGPKSALPEESVALAYGIHHVTGSRLQSDEITRLVSELFATSAS